MGAFLLFMGAFPQCLFRFLRVEGFAIGFERVLAGRASSQFVGGFVLGKGGYLRGDDLDCFDDLLPFVGWDDRHGPRVWLTHEIKLFANLLYLLMI